MLSSKTLLKEHSIWIVMLAVSVSLSIILVLQYRSLVELSKALPVVNRDLMGRCLATLASDVEDYYRTSAEQALSIPPEVFAAERYQNYMSGMVSYFEQHSAPGARSRFMAFTGQGRNKEMYSAVYFYDPSVALKFRPDPGSSRWRAAHAASGQYLYQGMLRINLDVPSVVVNEQDPDNRVITKPILDRNSTVLGVAGMIIDSTYLKEELLPELVQKSLRDFFSNDYHDIIVTLQDESGNNVFESQPLEGREPELGEPLRFVFKDLKLRIVRRTNSANQGAQRVVAVNLSVSVIMTCLLIAGVYMALRTASRDMKLSRMKSDFVSNVSHELRTPLASMRAFGELFRLGWVNEPEKSREYGEYIETESRRLTHLIDNILDFSKIESGGREFVFNRTNVREMVEETLRAFEVRFSQSKFDLVFEVHDEPLPEAVINRDAINQCLVNLIDNAIKYSGDSKRIIVRVGCEETYVTISVIDYGIGIPKNEQRRVFEKFYRVSTGLIHEVRGSGLGLAIVKHTMDAHRGKITVRSRPGFGSTFTLYLPADAADAKVDYRKETEFESSGEPVDSTVG